MPAPSPSGLLIYAKPLPVMSAFHEQVLEARLLLADAEDKALHSPDTQLILHAIPEAFGRSVVIDVPPVPRGAQAIKPFFTVGTLAEAEATPSAAAAGSGVRSGAGPAYGCARL